MDTLQNIDQSFVATVISGKGGVGKSMSSINIALQFKELGHSTAIIDADLGLSNCATFLNCHAKHTVSDWINGKCGLEQLPQKVEGITLITGASDPSQANISSEVMMDALDQITQFLKKTHDYIIIDTPAGAGEMSLWALDTADIGILVIVDEPAAISDVYRLCKYIYNIDPEYQFSGIVNFAENEESAEKTFMRFNTILNYFLKKKIPYWGFIPTSNSIKKSIMKQQPLNQSLNVDEELKEIKFITQQVIAYSANRKLATLRPVH
ncbi:P-loop NTPase [Gracilimonas sp. Q87]|uniref:P-loop NTPase n=1 Tax=Gracilimonas sp. Q87 TaxID=3384766 RepID=UPI00398454F1